ncbi:hypothetical protein BDW02DRAFT_566644 [Decorospora gaudefroyi]|uniref:A-kinase anchor protein 7-like phosphoesterase domain-containing protein n=1 Tax=Decorospora gaudefroyi TaxID=184978 RepID=A0A6A5KR41_9PLEO|nr:hypothetical protein BDW02DRAFT_566644 [Decorospora gaudefroyi]
MLALVPAALRRAASGPISPRTIVPTATAYPDVLCLAPAYTRSGHWRLPQPQSRFLDFQPYTTSPTMGKKKSKAEYNDFLDGEKLRDNTEIRTTLQGFAARDIPSAPRQNGKESKKKGKNGAKKPPLTHFLCLPLVTPTSKPQLRRGLERLKKDVAKDSPVPIAAVRPPGTLHLTLGVMSLSPEELQEATLYLQDLNLHTLLRDITHRRIAEKAAEDGTVAENLNAAAMPDTDALTVTLESLVPMQTPSKTSILYAEPRDASQRLTGFAEAVRAAFAERGWVVDDARGLRLHATLLNTIYAKPKGGRQAKGRIGKGGGDGAKTFERKNGYVDGMHEDQDQKQQEDEDGVSNEGSSVLDDAEAPPPSTAIAENSLNGAAGHGPDAKSWMRFDARNLIEEYKGFVWAEDIRIDRVRICKMGAKKVWSGMHAGDGEVLDEAYEVVAEKEIFPFVEVEDGGILV